MIVKIVFFLSLMTVSSGVFAQAKKYKRVERKLVKGLELNIKQLDAEAKKLRAEMIQIVDVEGLREKYVFGKNRELINEGMSKHFTQRPVVMGVKLKRKRNQELLEEKHVQLYDVDIELLLAKELLELIDRENKKGEENQIKKAFIEGHKRRESLKKAKIRLADIILRLSPSYKNGHLGDVFENPKEYDLAREEIPFADTCEREEYPFYEDNQMVIGASFPMNGQYNFHIFEGGGKKWGYIYLEKLDYDLFRDKRKFVKWTNVKGDYIYYPATFEYMKHILFFRIPIDFLEMGKVYELQVVGRPSEGYEYVDKISAKKRSVFGIKSTDTEEKMEGVVLLGAPIYFRTSSFRDSYDKFANKSPISLDSDGKIKIPLSEPLDSMELVGTGCYEPSYEFAFYNNLNSAIKKIQTGRVAYYMTMPVIEPIDTNNIEKAYTAFLDNTYEDLNMIYAEGNLPFAETKLGLKPLDYTVSQNVAVKKITKRDFDNGGAPSYQDANLVIEYPELAKRQQEYDDLVQKIYLRSKARSEYFYALYIVDSKRKKQLPKFGLSFFEEREKEILDIILPENVRKLSLIDVLAQFDRVGVSVYMPGTKINTTVQRLNNKKKAEQY